MLLLVTMLVTTLIYYMYILIHYHWISRAEINILTKKFIKIGLVVPEMTV